MTEFLAGIIFYTGLILLLTVLILLVREGLMQKKIVQVTVNGERQLQAVTGERLLVVLAKANMYLPAVCGGRGTCGQCRVIINSGGGRPQPTETSLLSSKEISRHLRLACQITIRNNLDITLSEEVFGVRKMTGTVRSNQSVATFIKELIIELPAGECIDFKAGSYVMVECPVFQLDFNDLEVTPEFEDEWARYGVRDNHLDNRHQVTRAYSMANQPEDNSRIVLNIRLALPPANAPKGTSPGIVSSYLYSLKAGDTVNFSGPFGHFFVRDSDCEMVFVGGGAGMAPLRSHILHQLLTLSTRRKISLWYGARSLKDLFYQDEFNDLQQRFENFEWHVALSEPRDDDKWSGPTGLIHQILLHDYLEQHPGPEDCEYYLCGPPLMNLAVVKMLEDLGIEKSNIMLDDFKS